MTRIESSINNILNRIPKLKIIIKRIYQLSMYAMFPKIKSEGDII